MKHAAHILLTIFALASCTTTRYVPIESVRTEYRDRFTTQRDSIYVSDSVFIREKGDTIFIDRAHTYYKDRFIHDTISIVVTDSVDRPYPVPTPLNKWQRLKQDVGGTAIGIILVLIIFYIVRFIRRR